MENKEAWDFEKTWQYQQGALFLKEENSSLEWKKNLAEFFFRQGALYGEEKVNQPLREAIKSLNKTDDLNSPRNLCALMAEGEGDNVETYKQMAKSAMIKIDEIISTLNKDK